jgi:chorismate mutase
MKNFTELRVRIDEIDQKLINLLQERSRVVHNVKKIKDSTRNKQFQLYIKPDREYSILTKIINTTSNNGYSKEFFYRTWRGIIAASNLLEQDLKLLATCKKSYNDIYQHFGMQCVPIIEEKPHKAFEKLQTDTFHILAFQFDNSAIFELLKSQKEIKIFALGGIHEEENYTFLCGKISLETFSSPSVVITTQKTNKILNKEANVFIAENCEVNESTIGCFYPPII